MEEKARDLIAECDQNINTGKVNSFASYDEGVRDALQWIYDGGPRPYVGRED